MAAYSSVRSAWSAPESRMQRARPALEKSTATGSTTGFAGLAKSMVMMLPTLEAI